MSKFFNYYTDKSHIHSVFHKAAIATTVMIPVFAVLLIVLSFFNIIASAILIAVVSLIYVLSAIMAVTVLFDKSQPNSNIVPLIASSLAGPAYVGLLLLLNPSFASVIGVALYILIPLAAIAVFFIDEFRRFERAENIIEFEDENMPLEDTVELEKVV